jgi:hypothetical protein
MFRIAKSLFVVLALAVATTCATSAVFTAQAKMTSNTFATGVLEIRINGLLNAPGFTYTNAAPGDSKSGQFTLSNYGAPWFAGPSTLAAKVLTLKAVRTSGDVDLFNKLTINITKDAGGTPEVIYSGSLGSFNAHDALVSYYHANGLIPGSSETIRYTVTLPENAGNGYMGASTTFDFVADAATS